MYKVKKAFIYRAKLYPIGQELTVGEYDRMMRDKVAVRRGIPEMVAPAGRPQPIVQEEIKEPVVVEKKPATRGRPPAKKQVEQPVAKKPAAKKPAAAAKPKKE